MGSLFPTRLVNQRESVKMNRLIEFADGSSVSKNWIPITVGVAVAAAAVYVGKRVLTKPPSAHTANDASAVKITLMAHEKDIMAIMPSVTTISTFRSNGCMPEAFLKRKMTEMLQKNPWLMGRLVTDPAEGMCLKYNTIDPNASAEAITKLVNKYYHVVVDFELLEDLPYTDFAKAFDHLQVKKGKECVDKDEQLFRVTLVKVKGREELALVFSVSHVISDGFTFYRLQNMLDRNASVEALSVTRSTQYVPELTKLLGKETVDWIHSPYLLFGLISCAMFRSHMQGHIVKVDNAWLAAQKAAFTAKKAKDVAFVSTNDILTAWHNKVCKSDIALMSINCRNRVPIFTEQMAGNYESSITYNEPSDGDTPEAVRRSLQTFHNASNSTPSALKTMLWNGSIVTNWSSFYQQIDISDASINCTFEHLLHLPIVDSKELGVWREGLCIFKMDAETTGMVVATRFLTPEMLEATGVGKICKTF